MPTSARDYPQTLAYAASLHIPKPEHALVR